MSNESTKTSIQIGPSSSGAIFIVLLLLKVFGVVDWSWWIITMPLWLGLAIFVAILAGGAALAGIFVAGVWIAVAVASAWDWFLKKIGVRKSFKRRY